MHIIKNEMEYQSEQSGRLQDNKKNVDSNVSKAWQPKNFFKTLLLFSFFSLSSLYAAKKALIFGITGQDGSYLAELLLEKGYEVHGGIRRASSIKTDRIDHLLCQLNLHYSDLTDATNVIRLIKEIEPDEIYNLGAQSHVRVSFDVPEYSAQCDALGALRVLEAIRILGLTKKTKYYQASTSEMFGKVQETPQTETTPFYPRSPYACAKLYAHWITKHYRESYDMFACSGILFNHESPRRGKTFLTRKVTQAAVHIKKGTQDCLYLGNLDAKRDWGYAQEYVEAMWLMMQQTIPDDFVIATGETHTVRECVEVAFQCVGIDIEWEGEEINEVGKDKATGKIVIRIDSKFFRPTEVDLLLGDPRKALKELGWQSKVLFKELIEMMIRADLIE